MKTAEEIATSYYRFPDDFRRIIEDIEALVAAERERCARIADAAQIRSQGMAKECEASGRNDFGWQCRVIGA